MEWTDLYVDGTISLNQRSLQINGSDASILVHYWSAWPNHYSNKPHQHSFFEICYIIDGNGLYVDQNQVFSLQKGSLFISRPYIQHQIRSETGMKIIFVGFELNKNNSKKEVIDLFTQLETTNTFFIKNATDTPVVKLWTSLLFMAARPYTILNDSIQGLCTSFYSSILVQFTDQQSRPKSKREYSSYSSLVYQAKLYIKDNLSESLKLNDVASHLHISGRHLSRIFHTELGQSFSSYVKGEKIRKAGLLLSDTDLSIKEVSDKTGFNNVHYFTRVFSQDMGLSPGKFRKKFKQQIL